MSVQPYHVGTVVYVRRSLDLDALVAQYQVPISREHYRFCGTHAVVASVRQVDSRGRVRAFFYKLHGIPLVWPHASLEPHAVISLEGHHLVVSAKRHREDRSTSGESPRIVAKPLAVNSLSPIKFLPELFVGSLPYRLSDHEFAVLFSDVLPRPTSASLVMDRQTGRSKGFGFVVYPDIDSAAWALADLHNRLGDLDHRRFVPPSHEWVNAVAAVEAPPLDTFLDGLEAIGTTVADIVRDFTERLAEQVALNPDDLISVEWRDIERLLTSVFARMGFDARCGPGSHDGGVDIELRGLRGRFSVQVKHWIATRVGAGVVSEYVQVAFRDGVASGILLATGGFTSTAFSGITILEKRRIRIGTRSNMVALCQAYMIGQSGLFRPDTPEAGLVYYTDPIVE